MRKDGFEPSTKLFKVLCFTVKLHPHFLLFINLISILFFKMLKNIKKYKKNEEGWIRTIN